MALSTYIYMRIILIDIEVINIFTDTPHARVCYPSAISKRVQLAMAMDEGKDFSDIMRNAHTCAGGASSIYYIRYDTLHNIFWRIQETKKQSRKRVTDEFCVPYVKKKKGKQIVYIYIYTRS